VLRPLLADVGIARSAALLPAGSSAGALGALLLPGFGPLLLARGLEVVLHNSVFRAAYELLFTPVSPTEKRTTKLLLDVGGARVGDVTAGALVQGALFTGLATATPLLGATMLLGIGALLVARQLHMGYVWALEQSLQLRAGELPVPAPDEGATLLQSFGAFDLSEFRQGLSATAVGPALAPGHREPHLVPPSPLAHRQQALASEDPEVVSRALAEGPLAPGMVEVAIGLLAWDEVAVPAIQALHAVARAETGRLVAHLLDPEEDFAIRRRLVRVLADAPSEEALTGLVAALEDQRFEVRYRAGRALARMVSQGTGLRVDRQLVIGAVLREVAVERGVWASRQLIDRTEDEWSPMEAEVLRDRATRSLEHVFTLLSLILPSEPLRVAFHGLHTEDAQLRGTALEYLVTVLPEQVREKLWPFLEGESRPVPRGRSPEQALEELLASRQSIVLALAAARERGRE
jgi:hypothetical protein